MGFLSDIGNAISSAADKVAGAVSDAANTAVNVALDGTFAAASAINGAGKAIGGAAGDVFNLGYELADGAIDLVTQNVPLADDAWDLFKGSLDWTLRGTFAAGNAIGSAFDEGVQVVGAAAYTAADLTLHPLRTAEEAIDTAKNLPGNAWDLVKGLVD